MLKRFILTIIGIILILSHVTLASAGQAPISEATQECLDCHSELYPGIIQDWRNSRHAKMTPKQAVKVDKLARRVSNTSIAESLQNHVVGCAECHTLRSDAHADTIEHNGYEIHVVVSPDDCATCHLTERIQFTKNLMAHAHNNLANNSLYQDLQRTILGSSTIQHGKIHFSP
ncbi:MAG: multiheme c-type cytochrome, partial [Desulfobacterales bacterium]